jgi:hypothetical protein
LVRGTYRGKFYSYLCNDCLFFAIPTTKKLQRANFLIENNAIIKKYMVSICLLSGIFLVVSGLIFLFGSSNAQIGYGVGILLAILFGIRKVGNNPDNVSEYYKTQSAFFKKPMEEIIAFITFNK